MKKFKVKKSLNHKNIRKSKNQNQYQAKMILQVKMQTLLKKNRLLLINKTLQQKMGEVIFIWQRNLYKIKRHLYKNNNNEKYFNLVQK